MMMDTILAALTHPLGLILLTLMALYLVGKGLHLTWQSRGIPIGGEDHMVRWLYLMQGFRFWIVGLCLLAIVAGVYWDSNALIIPAFIIGLEELYEATMVVTTLRWAEKNKRGESQHYPGMAGRIRARVG